MGAVVRTVEDLDFHLQIGFPAFVMKTMAAVLVLQLGSLFSIMERALVLVVTLLLSGLVELLVCLVVSCFVSSGLVECWFVLPYLA
jgi:hypothetical protein